MNAMTDTDAEYFACYCYQETMTRAQCLSWQKENEGAESADELPHIGCDGCDQGDEIRFADLERRTWGSAPREISPEGIAQAREHIANLGNKLKKNREENMQETQRIAHTKTCHVGKCSNCGRHGVSMTFGQTICHRCSKYAAGTRGKPGLRAQRLREATELYSALKPGERLPDGAAIAKKAGRAGETLHGYLHPAGTAARAGAKKMAPVEERPPETARGGAAHPGSPGESLTEVEEKSPAPIAGEERFAGVLLEAAEPHTVIPVTLRLTVEIVVKVNGIQA